MENKDNKVKKERAVALKYGPDDIAPKVVASGKGYVAQKIVELAKTDDVPVYKDEKLVEELTKIDLGDNIPPELYEIVAQVLIFINDLDKNVDKYKGYDKNVK